VDQSLLTFYFTLLIATGAGVADAKARSAAVFQPLPLL
jgi:hypothetical protein